MTSCHSERESRGTCSASPRCVRRPIGGLDVASGRVRPISLHRSDECEARSRCDGGLDPDTTIYAEPDVSQRQTTAALVAIQRRLRAGSHTMLECHTFSLRGTGNAEQGTGEAGHDGFGKGDQHRAGLPGVRRPPRLRRGLPRLPRLRLHAVRMNPFPRVETRSFGRCRGDHRVAHGHPEPVEAPLREA